MTGNASFSGLPPIRTRLASINEKNPVSYQTAQLQSALPSSPGSQGSAQAHPQLPDEVWRRLQQSTGISQARAFTGSLRDIQNTLVLMRIPLSSNTDYLRHPAIFLEDFSNELINVISNLNHKKALLRGTDPRHPWVSTVNAQLNSTHAKLIELVSEQPNETSALTQQRMEIFLKLVNEIPELQIPNNALLDKLIRQFSLPQREQLFAQLNPALPNAAGQVDADASFSAGSTEPSVCYIAPRMTIANQQLKLAQLTARNASCAEDIKAAQREHQSAFTKLIETVEKDPDQCLPIAAILRVASKPAGYLDTGLQQQNVETAIALYERKKFPAIPESEIQAVHDLRAKLEQDALKRDAWKLDL